MIGKWECRNLIRFIGTWEGPKLAESHISGNGKYAHWKSREMGSPPHNAGNGKDPNWQNHIFREMGNGKYWNQSGNGKPSTYVGKWEGPKLAESDISGNGKYPDWKSREMGNTLHTSGNGKYPKNWNSHQIQLVNGKKQIETYWVQSGNGK